MKLPSVAPLDDAARARFVRVAGLLGRPMLDDAHRAEAKALLLAADWRPVPPLAVLAGIEALMAHHAIDLGFALEAAPDLRTLPAGAFDDPGWITPEHSPFRHVFLRSRRSWSDLTPLVEQYERHFRTS